VTVALEGFHAVKHALRFAPDLVDGITVTDVDAVRRLADQLAPDVTDALLGRATVGEVEHPTGVEGTARRPAEDRSVLTSRTTPLVLLDQPRHPGNAGAVIRVAAAAGASGVAVTGTLDPWHAAVVRGSAGLHYALPVLHVEEQQVTGPLLVLDADGDEGWDVPDDAVLVVGSERDGVGAQLRSRADLVVRLPMTPGVSSLNLATATAAVLYRWRLSGSVSKRPEHLPRE
jgi:TrmH family RNA methyltransferase